MSSPNLIQPIDTLRRRRAHLIAGTCVVALLYAGMVLFIRLALL